MTKRTLSTITSLALLVGGGTLQAGEPAGAKSVFEEPPILLEEESGTQVKFILPGWLAGIEGTIGVGGLESQIDASFGDVIENLDMILAGGLEVRRGKFGILLEGLWIKASVGGSTPGRLLSNIDVGIEEVLAEAALTYRILEGDRGWLEIIGGARYMYLATDLNLTLDNSGVRGISNDLSGAVINRATSAAQREINARLPSLLADLGPRTTGQVNGRVQDSVGGISNSIGDIIDREIGTAGPGFGDRVQTSGDIQDAIRDYVKARVEERVEDARAKASAAVGAARAKARKQAKKKLAKAEARLAKAIERGIRDRIPEQLSGSKSWVDPFVGVRGRYNITDRCYAIGRADIGGFGVGSDLSWNLYGALGYEVTDCASIELGYRHFDFDFRDGDFVFDGSMSGPFVGVGIEF